MSEMGVLQFALWTFGVSSFITMVVSVVLVWSMRGQQDRSQLGTLFRWYYAFMAPFSFIKGTLFTYYGSRSSGGPEWLPDEWRIVVLLAGSVVSVALDVISVLLVMAYFKARDDAPRERSPT